MNTVNSMIFAKASAANITLNGIAATVIACHAGCRAKAIILKS